MSPKLERRLREADRVNPGLYRVFRSKLPGLYLACAKRIRRERVIGVLKLLRAKRWKDEG